MQDKAYFTPKRQSKKKKHIYKFKKEKKNKNKSLPTNLPDVEKIKCEKMDRRLEAKNSFSGRGTPRSRLNEKKRSK